jgi:UDP-N-acetylglucosamine/UDP-N-acetylgalactosamine diphosphorylase
MNTTVEHLLKRGLDIRAPESVWIDDRLDPRNIADGVTIYPGCRLSGEQTSVGPGCILGEEAPVTIDDCQLAGNVSLKGGYFAGTTMLAGTSFASAAHVRPGTLLEEGVNCGHAVGLKQTLLFPFVTTGSLINFCDCFMSGGTGPRDHGEVGSSFIHFNFTAHQDKATPSLIGDVPRGVLLDQPPIFLGGQGGLIGPVRVAFGTLLAAGTILRRDITECGTLVTCGSKPGTRTLPYDTRIYGDVSRIVLNNFNYLGNLHALLAWYRYVRAPFMTLRRHDAACFNGAIARLGQMITERCKRLDELSLKLERSADLLSRSENGSAARETQNRFVRIWQSHGPVFKTPPGDSLAQRSREQLLAAMGPLSHDMDYLTAVRSLSPDIRLAAKTWLQSVVDVYASLW